MFAEFKGRWIAILADAFERLAVVLLYAPFAVAFAARVPSHPSWMLIAISEALVVLFVLIRRPGDMAISLYPFAYRLCRNGLALVRPSGGWLRL